MFNRNYGEAAVYAQHDGGKLQDLKHLRRETDHFPMAKRKREREREREKERDRDRDRDRDREREKERETSCFGIVEADYYV